MFVTGRREGRSSDSNEGCRTRARHGANRLSTLAVEGNCRGVYARDVDHCCPTHQDGCSTTFEATTFMALVRSRRRDGCQNSSAA